MIKRNMVRIFTSKMSVQQSFSRDLSLDIMKGIGIILVVYGHTYLKSSFIYLFHMPLFFLLSGAAMNFTHHRYSITRRFKSIMVPYFVFSFLCFCYWAFLESRFRPIHEDVLFMGTIGQLSIKMQQFLNIFIAENCINSFGYNVVLWFLPCLFVADLIYEQVRHIKFSWVVILLVVALYYLVFDKRPCMPWCFNIAMLAIPFIWLGKVGYKKLVVFYGSHQFLCGALSVILFAILYGMFKYLGVQINMFGNIIPPFYSFYSAAIIGSMAVAFLAISISRISIRGGKL